MKIKTKILSILSLILILTLCIIWIVWGNTALRTRAFTISSKDLPNNFNGFKIAHISDLHNTEFGQDNLDLLNLLSDSNSDIIVITGDLVDSRKTDLTIALDFVREATKIAPVYFVTGNHESRITEYKTLLKGLKECGATVLCNQSIELRRNGQTIQLLGLTDPTFYKNKKLEISEDTYADSVMKDLSSNSIKYKILLSHRPELFDVYVKNNLQLVFSGHAHGGQFRLPFFGGLAAPDQGLFPKYDSGLFTENNTNMVVSQGLGNSLFPFRMNNRPEIIIVTLEGAYQ